MTEELTLYQKEIQLTLELLQDVAREGKGRVLDPVSVRHVVTYVQSLSQAVRFLETALAGAENMISAYVNEYGSELFDTLIDEMAPEVEAEVISNADQETDKPSEDDGVDSQGEGEESRPVSEDVPAPDTI